MYYVVEPEAMEVIEVIDEDSELRNAAPRVSTLR